MKTHLVIYSSFALQMDLDRDPRETRSEGGKLLIAELTYLSVLLTPSPMQCWPTERPNCEASTLESASGEFSKPHDLSPATLFLLTPLSRRWRVWLATWPAHCLRPLSSRQEAQRWPRSAGPLENAQLVTDSATDTLMTALWGNPEGWKESSSKRSVSAYYNGKTKGLRREGYLW